MKTNFSRAWLACAALALSSTAAFAAPGDPIPGIEVGLEGDPPSDITARARVVTDANGSVTFRDLAPGKYVLTIDGKSLVAAMDKLAPAAPEKKESQSSFSLGIGGFLGGGSSHSSGDRGGGGPVGGGSHGGSHSSSGGGMGAGISVPLGGSGDKGSAQPGYSIIGATIDWGDGTSTSTETAYCRDAAIHGMKFHVTNVRGGTIIMSIYDRGDNGTSTSY